MRATAAHRRSAAHSGGSRTGAPLGGLAGSHAPGAGVDGLARRRHAGPGSGGLPGGGLGRLSLLEAGQNIGARRNDGPGGRLSGQRRPGGLSGGLLLGPGAARRHVLRAGHLGGHGWPRRAGNHLGLARSFTTGQRLAWSGNDLPWARATRGGPLCDGSIAGQRWSRCLRSFRRGRAGRRRLNGRSGHGGPLGRTRGGRPRGGRGRDRQRGRGLSGRFGPSRSRRSHGSAGHHRCMRCHRRKYLGRRGRGWGGRNRRRGGGSGHRQRCGSRRNRGSRDWRGRCRWYGRGGRCVVHHRRGRWRRHDRDRRCHRVSGDRPGRDGD